MITAIKALDIKHISELVRKENFDPFIIEVYSDLLNAFQNLDSKKDYSKYKDSFFKYRKKFSRDELSYHYSMLISYCIMSNSVPDNKESYDSELFNVYKNFLNGKYFYDKKTKNIDEDLYRNILLLSLRLRELKWAYRFISVYSKYLHSEKKDNLIKLSFAEYYYHAGSFRASVKMLNKSFHYIKEIEEKSFIIKHDIKSLYLMLYYDLHYDETLIIQINNYRKFLNRNKLVAESRKVRISKFLNTLEKLTYLREGNPKVNHSELNLNIKNLKDINYRHWFEKKLEEIKT